MSDRWIVPGSERQFPSSTQVLGDAPADEDITVTLWLRSKRPGVPPPGALSRQDFGDIYGADREDMQNVEAFAREHELRVVESNAARRSIILRGTVAQMNAAFDVALKRCKDGSVTYRGRAGSISLPATLSGVVEAVLGLDNRPQARPSLRISAQPEVSYTPLQIAQLYDFPIGIDGNGECIGIVELGGGFSQTDFSSYLSRLGISAQTVTIVSVDGATSSPGNQDADVEVMLDTELAGALAPAAKLVLYFAPNTDQGFLDAITTAVHDQTNNPSVISISWGGPESTWTQQARNALNQAISAAGATAVSVCVASGDGGSSGGINDGKPHVDFPASSPYVLGCGGTTLRASGNTIASEAAWSDSGGGVSDFFVRPDWQSSANVPPPPSGSSSGRGVPDVAGDANPDTGYEVTADGASVVAGGTSAVAPLWAALIALINQQLGRKLGFLNSSLYAVPGYGSNPGPLHEITSGSNGAYRAGPGWNPCTGLGTPDGQHLAQALARAAPNSPRTDLRREGSS
jgi:kumamolisin